MSWLVKIGQFFRILDDNGQLSLTNISMYITLYKLYASSGETYSDIGAFLISAAVYAHKKVINANQPNP